MASIEQDDIFNVQDDMMDEDDNYDMNQQQQDNDEDQELAQDSDGAGEDSGGEGDDSGGEGDGDDSNGEGDGEDSNREGEDSNGEGDDSDDSDEEEQDNNTQDIRDVDDDEEEEEEDETTHKQPEKQPEPVRAPSKEPEGSSEMDIDSKQENDEFSHLSPRERMIAKARIASEFDIIPTLALPYTSQCQSLAFTDGPKWILTGGEDGFIRKYDLISSIQGKNLLTTAQRQNLVDSITKAGVIVSYWENEQPITRKELMAANPKIKPSDFEMGSLTYEPKVNPVYALEAEKNGYWCLSGLSSGGIALYTMRHNEGGIHHYFSHGDKRRGILGHTDAVSVLKLNQSQDKLLSGSWDKSIKQWDLRTGNCITSFAVGTGQLSTIQYRPQGLTDLSIPYEESADNAEPDEDVDSLFGDSDEDESNRKPDEKQEKKSPSQVVSKAYENESIFMSSSIDGTISIWDVRAQDPVIRFGISEGIPPWCMSATWSNCGDFIYAGRRNSTVEEFSLKMPHKRSTTGSHKDMMVPNVLKLLSFPKISGPVTALATMPNNDFILCGSNDNIRLYNLQLYDELGSGSASTNYNTSAGSSQKQSKKPATPFLIIPGHQGGILSCLHVDETGRFMVSASGNRGWGHASYTETVVVYEIDFEG